MIYLILIDRGYDGKDTFLIKGPLNKGHMMMETVIEQAKLHVDDPSHEVVHLASFVELAHINHEHITVHHWVE